MSVATWLAIGLLGVGSLAIFLAFLRDWRHLFGERPPDGGD